MGLSSKQVRQAVSRRLHDALQRRNKVFAEDLSKDHMNHVTQEILAEAGMQGGPIVWHPGPTTIDWMMRR